MPLSISQLRTRLRSQLQDGCPRMQSIDTEGQLTLTLARSRRPAEQEEALERAESLWRELEDSASPLPLTSITGLRVSLCTSMRRCALVARKQELAESWTRRFANLRNLQPMDFTTGANVAAGRVRGWQHGRPAEETDQEEMSGGVVDDDGAGAEGAGRKSGNKETPLQKYRQEVMMDHPMMQLAFKRGVHTPGPRYTGD